MDLKHKFNEDWLSDVTLWVTTVRCFADDMTANVSTGKKKIEKKGKEQKRKEQKLEKY